VRIRVVVQLKIFKCGKAFIRVRSAWTLLEIDLAQIGTRFDQPAVTEWNYEHRRQNRLKYVRPAVRRREEPRATGKYGDIRLCARERTNKEAQETN